jgi:hypothetical protein
VLNPGEYLINGRSAGTQFSLSALSVGLCDYNRPVAELTDEDRAFLDRRACGGGGS